MPLFSRLAARNDWPAWGREVREALRLAVFEGILSGAMMVVLAESIVRLLFQYNKFTPEHTTRAAHVMVFYGVAMWAYCAQHIVLRGFYSMHDVRTPLKISVAVLPLNVALTLVLVWFDGIREAAFALSSMLTAGLSVVVGALILERRAGMRLLDGKMLWRHDMGWSIEAGIWYSPWIVYDVDGDGRAEVYCKAGEGDPRDEKGLVQSGPEWLVKLDGLTGKVVAKTNWLSREGFPEYNYYCRNFLTVAYLDGKRPSLIMQRGTYNVIKTQERRGRLKKHSLRGMSIYVNTDKGKAYISKQWAEARRQLKKARQ